MRTTDLHRHMHATREQRRNPGPPETRLDLVSAEIGRRADRLADDVLPWLAAVAVVVVFAWVGLS